MPDDDDFFLFGWGQDDLRKIVTTLAVKNEEIQNFIYLLKQMLQNVEVTGLGAIGEAGG